jgi:hypothetical protein
LKTLAYYGLALDFVMAIGSDVMAGDGLWMYALVALILLILSYTYDRKLYG